MAKKTESEMSNPRFLQVLMVEDSEDDALLEIRELKKGGYNPVYERVETAAAMKKALKEKQWDIILCDYKLPKFNAPSAIAVLKETNIDIPVIIVSGAIGEETAVECMRLGAHDYIMKNNLSRLCPAITRELEEADSRSKRKQADEALRESEALYRSQFEDHSAVKLLIDPDTGNIIDANEAAANFYGWSREKLKQMKIQEISTLSPEEVIKAMKMVKTQKRIHFEFRQRRADGSIRNVDVFSSKIKAKGKDILHSIIHDITERKRAEEALRESEERMRSIFRAAPTGIGVLTDRTFMDVNLRMCEMTGYTKEELIGASARVLYPTQDDFDYVGTEKYRQIAQKGTGSVETRWKKTDGTIIDVLLSSTPIDPSDLSRGVTFTALDITERKQTEEELRKSEGNFRRSLDESPLGVRILAAEGETIYVNQAVLDIYGYSSIEEMKRRSVKERYTPQGYAEYKTRKKKREQGEFSPPEYEVSIVRKNGEVRHLRAFRKEILWNGVKQAQIIYQDITKRKQAEEALTNSEAKLRKEQKFSQLLLDNSPALIVAIGLDGKTLMMNKALLDTLEYTTEEIKGADYLTTFVPEEDRGMLAGVFQKIMQKRITTLNENRIISKSGRTYLVEWHGATVSHEVVETGFFVGVGIDITERKRAEEAMRKSEERYRTMFESTGTSMILVEEDMTISMANGEFVRNTGYSPDEIIGRMKWTDLVHPDDLGRMVEQHRLRRESQGGALPSYEFRYRTKSGDLRDTLLTIDVLPGTRKSIASLIDITDRKHAEEELLRSEEKYRSLVENSQEGIFQSTAEGHHITVNQAFANILGYESPEEVLATIADIPHQVYVHPEDRTKILQIIEKEGSVKGYEAEFYKKDGSKTWVSINMRAIRDEEGHLLYYQGIDQDIMEKKNMETERQQNIARLRKSLQATINAMASTVETRDPYTAGHQLRVADLARSIAAEMHLNKDQIDSIRMASSIHDIGKIALPAEILSKPTKLTDLEFGLIKTHSQSGYDILKDIEFPWPVADVVLQHHERMDGSGYPHGLKGENISLEARILAVADVVEAITSHRPYRAALGIDVALEEISRNRGILYDADVVDACLKLFREKGYTLVIKK